MEISIIRGSVKDRVLSWLPIAATRIELVRLLLHADFTTLLHQHFMLPA